MGLIIQKRALDAAGGLRQVLLAVRKQDKALFDQSRPVLRGSGFGVREPGAETRGARWR